MPNEEILIETRQAKHREINGGTYPLAQEAYDISTVIYYFERYGNEESIIPTTIDPAVSVVVPQITIHGRLSAVRRSGALTFMKITDSTGSVQLIATKMFLSNYANLHLLDLGDLIEVEGKVAWSKTHERSVLVTSWRLLTKAIRPPPEKFIGIQDTELKYRKRYLDLMSSEESRARFTVRSYILRAIRQFMDERHFLEVETSTLSTIASGANAKPFTTHHNALDTDLRLRIAPELNLKRLLVAGMDRVYEIGRAYRNEGIDTRHNPEFTIMEFYEAYGKFPDLIVMTKSLLRDIDRLVEEQLPKNVLPFYQQWRADRPFSWSQCVEVTMEQVVQNALDKASMTAYLGESYYGEWYNFTPPEYCSESALQRQAKIDFMGLYSDLNKAHSRGERLSIFFEYMAEPFLTEDYRSSDGKHSQPVFITKYPKEISPLARPSDTDPNFTDRFELFVEGRELANAFQELNNPAEQERAFQDQLQNNDRGPMAYDHDYVEALEHGMPPAIGFGLGIDRLVMLLTGTSSIKDVILFPTLRPNYET